MHYSCPFHTLEVSTLQNHTLISTEGSKVGFCNVLISTEGSKVGFCNVLSAKRIKTIRNFL